MNTVKQTPSIVSSRAGRAPIPIEAPDIAIAFHDEDNFGLIPVSVIGSPIKVDLKVWEGANTGYIYQLMWDGKAKGPEKIIQPADTVGDPLELELPVELQTEGPHSLGFRAYSPNTTVEDLSEVFSVVIDITAPGKPELAAIQFPVEVQNGLTAAELTRLGGQLEVEVAGYTGMAKHDVISTYWGDLAGPTATVTQDDMGLNKVLISFPTAFLESVPSGPQPVRYTVTDRAGNISEDSITTMILLLLEEIPADYPAPIVDPVVGELIDYLEARPGVRVDIPHYPGASAFDQITLHWGDDQPMFPVQLPAGDENEDIVISVRVPFETIAAKPVGTAAVSYTVTRQNQLNGSSLKAGIDVFLTLPVTEPTLPPIIQGTSVNSPDKTDNFIDEDDYELNSRAIIQWNDQFKLNDDLNLFWGDQTILQWHQISEEDLAAQKDLAIPIGNSIMKAQGTGAEIPVRYSIIRDSNPNPVASPTQKVTVRSKEELPGGTNGIDGPTFKLTPTGYISLIVAPDGTDGLIKPYENIAQDQQLLFTFKGYDLLDNPIDAATFIATRELDDQDVINGYNFKVPFNTLRTICLGYCEAYVRVEPAAGSNQSAVTSKVTRVPVDMRRTNETACTLTA
jgi:hypothetical protein